MLNHKEEIGKHAGRITKIKTNNKIQMGRNKFSIRRRSLKKFEKDIVKMDLMFCLLKKIKYILLVSKNNSNREK